MQLLVALIRKVRQVDELRVIRIIRHSFGPRFAAAVLEQLFQRGCIFINGFFAGLRFKAFYFEMVCSLERCVLRCAQGVPGGQVVFGGIGV